MEKIYLELTEFSEFNEFNKSQKYELGIIQGSCMLLMTWSMNGKKLAFDCLFFVTEFVRKRVNIKKTPKIYISVVCVDKCRSHSNRFYKQ